MKRLISLLDSKSAVFVLALLWLPSICSNTHAQHTSASQDQPARHIFTPRYVAKAMPMSGAMRASVHTFRAEDGTPVYQSDDWYKSASDARSGLDRLTIKASRVIKQGMKKDAKGHLVGKRVELLFSYGRNARPETIIAWTDGSTVVRLRSTSLPLLLDFENQYYP